MPHETFEHLTSQLDTDDLALGWLSSVTHFKATAAVATRPHRHRNLEMILCLKGELHYEIDDAAPVPLVVGTGSGIIIPEGHFHTLRGGTEVPGERIGLHITRRMEPANQRSVFTPSDFAQFRRTLASNAARVFRLGPVTLDTARHLAALLTRPTLSSPELGLARLHCCSVLYHVARTLSEPHAEPRPQMMDEAVRYLETHFAEHVTISDLVRFMGYSRANLFKLFKLHTGLSPNDWLVRHRIQKAREMLLANRLSVAEVARQTGFSDASYFARVFRRYTGLAPSVLQPNR